MDLLVKIGKKYCLYSAATLYFPLSLKDNIRFMKQMQQMKKLKELLMKSAFVHSLHHFQMGYTKRIGEGGRMLSGGQEQRVAMARALLSKNQSFY